MMTESIILFMFNLNQYIELAFGQLIDIVEKVDTKFTQFSNIASTVTDAKDVSNVKYELAITLIKFSSSTTNC